MTQHMRQVRKESKQMTKEWGCYYCDEFHNKPEECCFCQGEGHDEGIYCECPAGKKIRNDWDITGTEYPEALK